MAGEKGRVVVRNASCQIDSDSSFHHGITLKRKTSSTGAKHEFQNSRACQCKVTLIKLKQIEAERKKEKKVTKTFGAQVNPQRSDSCTKQNKGRKKEASTVTELVFEPSSTKCLEQEATRSPRYSSFSANFPSVAIKYTSKEEAIGQLNDVLDPYHDHEKCPIDKCLKDHTTSGKQFYHWDEMAPVKSTSNIVVEDHMQDAISTYFGDEPPRRTESTVTRLSQFQPRIKGFGVKDDAKSYYESLAPKDTASTILLPRESVMQSLRMKNVDGMSTTKEGITWGQNFKRSVSQTTILDNVSGDESGFNVLPGSKRSASQTTLRTFLDVTDVSDSKPPLFNSAHYEKDEMFLCRAFEKTYPEYLHSSNFPDKLLFCCCGRRKRCIHLGKDGCCLPADDTTSSIVAEMELENLTKGPQEVKYGLLLPPNRSPLKVLLVFAQTDPVSEAMSRAADKLGFDVTFSTSYDSALEEFLAKLHDLVIVDTRGVIKSLDFDTLCRSIRNTKGSHHTTVAAIVRKSAFDKDDVTVLSLLDAGYNRCIIETSNVVHYVNELIQLKHSDIRPMAQTATNQALYAALEKCKDIVLITDDSLRLQYANRSSERTLGYRCDETLGKTLQEQLANDPIQVNAMNSSLMRAREWQGQFSLRRKGQEPISMTCRAVPITCAGRTPTHFVMVLDLSMLEPIGATSDKPRGSVHSIRRPSTDVRSVSSEFTRRTSLAKLNALPLEAPITRIYTLLAQAQEQSNPQVSSIIDKAVEILHSTELYSPHVKDDLRLRSDEPVTSDLISALLTQPHQPSISISSRRSSNDSNAVARGSATRPVSKIKIPSQIKELLEFSLTWEFDIFRLEELTNKRPLVHLGMNILLHFDVAATLNCDEKTLQNWLTVIEMNYHAENSYHNSTHAADVMQATAGFLEKDRLKSFMEPLDEATSLLAASAHDVDHPGKSSAFLSNSDNPLAILYNDVTVLENHHAALMFKLTIGDDRVNIFKHLDRETYKVARHNVIDMILATEMTKHFEHLAKFVNVFCMKTSRSDLETDDYTNVTLQENITLVKRMMIKCADVSNPTRPLRLCVEWSRRIAEEYFSQTDDEKARGLPVVMPMFDRTTCSIPKSQIGFVDYIVHDMFEAWDAFIDMPELVTYMRQNYIRWKEFDEQGHTTSADIRKLQNTVLMAPIFSSKNPPKRSE